MSSISPRDTWQRKLNFLLTQEAVAVDSAEKFKLREEIAEARARINELDGERHAGTSPPKIAPTRLRHSAEKLIGREAELARLDGAWTDPAKHVLTIVAFGGV